MSIQVPRYSVDLMYVKFDQCKQMHDAWCRRIFKKKKKCGVRECKSVLRCGLIWQRALKLCDISFLFGLLARWSFDSFGQSDCISQTDLFSRVFISLCEWSFFIGSPIFASFHSKCCYQVRKFPHKITSWATNLARKKRKQYINTAFTFDSCKLLVLSHRISCILYYECYECITFFSKLHIVMIYSYVIDDARWIAFQSAVDARENRYDSLTSTAKKRKHSIERISPQKKMGQRKCRFLKPQQHTL